VIVPNYNHERFLDERMESILNQDYQDFELIFLDDASTDGSRDLFLDKYAGLPRVQHHFNEANTGNPFRQWNRGVSRASGQFIWIAESDDFADPRLLGSLVEKLQSNPRAGVAYTQSLRVDPEGSIINSGTHWTADLDHDLWSRDFVRSGEELCRKYLAVKNVIPNASAVVFRRSVFDGIGGACEDYRLVGDWITWIHMMLVSDVCFVAEPWNRFRVHPQTVRSGSVLDGRWALEHYRVIQDLTQKVEIGTKTRRRAVRMAMAKWITSSTVAGSAVTDKRHREIIAVARTVDSKLVKSAIQLVRPGRLRNYFRFLVTLRRLVSE